MMPRFVHGGGQESGLRAGTENVPGIVGYGVAAECALAGLSDFGTLADLRDALEERVLAIEPSAIIFGKGLDRLPNTSKFATKGLTSEVQVMGLDLDGRQSALVQPVRRGVLRRPTFSRRWAYPMK